MCYRLRYPNGEHRICNRLHIIFESVSTAFSGKSLIELVILRTADGIPVVVGVSLIHVIKGNDIYLNIYIN